MITLVAIPGKAAKAPENQPAKKATVCAGIGKKGMVFLKIKFHCKFKKSKEKPMGRIH